MIESNSLTQKFQNLAPPTILFVLAFFFYTYVGGLEFQMYTPIVQIIPPTTLQASVTYWNILYDLTTTPPLLSILRKISLSINAPITIYCSLFLLYLSTVILYQYLRKKNYLIATLVILIYLLYPATWIFNLYEYDVGLYVSLTILLFISLDYVTCEHKFFGSLLSIFIIGIALSLLSSKWTVLSTLIVLTYTIFLKLSKRRKILLVAALLFQLILPIKNLIYDGILSNSTWMGLNLGMVAQNIYVENPRIDPITGFYMSSEDIAKYADCDDRTELFGNIMYGCVYVNASKNDLKNSKKRILDHPLRYINQGVWHFNQYFYRFPDNYDNSGMSYKNLKFRTYQIFPNFYIAFNVILFYFIPIICLFSFRDKFSLLCSIFIASNILLMSLVNGIELDRMKFYYIGVLFINIGTTYTYIIRFLKKFSKNGVYLESRS